MSLDKLKKAARNPSNAATRALARGIHPIPDSTPKRLLRGLVVEHAPKHPRALFLDPGDTAVHIGTPNPWRARGLAELVGNDGKVVIFEPEENNYNQLLDVQSEYSNVNVDNRGVWSEETTQTLAVAEEDRPGDHKIPVDGIEHDNDYIDNAYVTETEVEVAPLDSLIDEYNIEPNYVEAGVNGAELEVLDGADRILSEFAPKVWLKGHARETDTKKPLNQRMKIRLETYGYNVVITKGGHDTVTEIDDWENRAGDVFGWR